MIYYDKLGVSKYLKFALFLNRKLEEITFTAYDLAQFTEK